MRNETAKANGRTKDKEGIKQGSRRDESGRKHGRSRDGHWAGMVKDEAVKANERSAGK